MEISTVPTRFQILSDLHLETPLSRPTYDEFSITPQAPYLALLGDIGYVRDGRLFVFLETQLRRFKIVFFLLGNHEPYGATFPAAKAAMRAFQAQTEKATAGETETEMGKLIFLDQTPYYIPGSKVTVLGCTLYSCVPPAQRGSVSLFVSDFQNISDWTVDQHNSAHDSDLYWLNEQITTIAMEDPSRKIVVFTHHGPTRSVEANDPKHLEDAMQVNSAFVTDLSREVSWTSPQVKLWAFRHTLFNCEFVDAQTGKRVLTNQKGYRREERFDFDPGKAVDVAELK